MPTLVSNRIVYKIKTDDLVSVLIKHLDSPDGTISYDVKSSIEDAGRNMIGFNIYVQYKAAESLHDIVSEVVAEKHWLYELDEIKDLVGSALNQNVTKIIWHWNEENPELIDFAEVHTD